MSNINIRKLVDPNSGEQFYPQTDINGLVNNGGSGVDEEPVAASSNLVKSGGVKAFVEERAEFQESGRFILAVVDANENVVVGITKDCKLFCDDAFLSNALVSYNETVNEKLALKVNISDIVDNLTTSTATVPLSAKQGFTLKGLIDTLVDSLAETQSMYRFATSNQYLIAIVDADEKVLWGIKKDGGLYEPTKFIESSQYVFVITDDDDKVLFGIKKDGNIYAPGFEIADMSDVLHDIEESVGALEDKTDNLQGQINSINSNEGNNVEIAIGKHTAGNSYASEMEACPIVDNQSEYYVGYEIVNKDKTTHVTTDKIIMMNHDDGYLGDMIATRRIYNKYGFKANVCAVFEVFSSLSNAKQKITNYKKWLNEGHEIGLHAILHCSYWKINKLYDIKPDGSSNFAPTRSELRGSNGDGTGVNVFGSTVTANTAVSSLYTTLGTYNNGLFDVKIVNLTDAQVNEINQNYCFYTDRLVYTGIDDLAIADIMSATAATTVSKTRIGWLEYYYNGLIDNTLGFSSTADTVAGKFVEDYDVPSGASAGDYYPDAAHILNGKMVYWNDSANAHYAEAKLKTAAGFSDNDYQLVGKFTKGLYKGCFSTCNWEVMDRVVACATAFFRHYYDLNHFGDCHRHGVAYTGLFYQDANHINYLNREKTVVETSYSKFHMSRLGCFRSEIDIMSEFGISFIKELGLRQKVEFEGVTGNYYGQAGILDSKMQFAGTVMNDHDYTGLYSLFGTTSTGMEEMNYADFMTFVNGIDNWENYFFNNAGQEKTRGGLTRTVYAVFRDAILCAISSIGTGKVPLISFDTIRQSPAIVMGIDLILRVFKELGFEVVTLTTGKEKILATKRKVGGNLFPNPGFNQSLLDCIGESTDFRAYIPDGWTYVNGSPTISVGDNVTNDVTRRAMSIAGSGILTTRMYGLPAGNYRMSLDAKCSSENGGKVQFRKIKNNDRLDSVAFTDYAVGTTWETETIDFTVEEPHKNPFDESKPFSVLFNGYEDNVCRVDFRVNSESGNTLQIANVKLTTI